MEKSIEMELLVKKIKEDLLQFAKKYGAPALNYIKDLQESISKSGGLMDFFKEAWSLEEKNTDVFAFKECIQWSKENIGQFKLVAVYKTLNKDSLDAKGKPRKMDIHVCFMNDKKEPVLDGSASHLLVHCDEIDSDFANCFGNKDMIVLQ